MSSVGGGERSDAATAYLYPAAARPNVDVLAKTQVTRLLPVHPPSGDACPEFRVVEIAHGPDSTLNLPASLPVLTIFVCALGPRRTVTASKEVIVAAGALGSPHLLQLSGVGSRALLSSFDIPTIIDNPAVGEGYQNHVGVAIHCAVEGETWDTLFHDRSIAEATMQQWLRERKGLFVNSPANTQTYLRIPEDDPIWKEHGAADPAAGPQSAHLELIYIVCTHFVDLPAV